MILKVMIIIIAIKAIKSIAFCGGSGCGSGASGLNVDDTNTNRV
jgi:hypothetical protein